MKLIRLFAMATIVAGLCSCGGGSVGNNGGGGNPPVVTSVTVTCNPSTITTSQTSDCAAAVAGTGNFSTAVTWSVSSGSITPSGVVTPSGAGTITVKAVSNQTPAVSGTATVTVTAVAPTITSFTPTIIRSDAGYLSSMFQVVVVKGQNFQNGQTINISPTLSIVSAAIKNSNEIDMEIAFDTSHYSPGQYQTEVCESAGVGCSAPFVFALVPSQNMMCQFAGGDYFFLAQGGSSYLVYRYHVENGMASLVTSFAAGGSFGMACDDNTGNLVFTTASGPGYATLDVTDQNGTRVTTFGVGTAADAIAAGGKNVCAAEPTANAVVCIVDGTTFVTIPNVGSNPCAIASLSSGTMLAYSCNDMTLWLLDPSNQTILSSMPLTGITAGTAINGSNGMQVVSLASGSVAFVSPVDEKLIAVNATGTTLTQLSVADLSENPGSAGSIVGAYADDANNAFGIMYTNGPQAVPVLSERVDPATGKITKIAATDADVPVGRLASAANIVVGARNSVSVLLNQ
ncbi:MAG: hypothetical protein WCC89_01125 [Candidatus Sulfotelmatobacter sp.]